MTKYIVWEDPVEGDEACWRIHSEHDCEEEALLVCETLVYSYVEEVNE